MNNKKDLNKRRGSNSLKKNPKKIELSDSSTSDSDNEKDKQSLNKFEKNLKELDSFTTILTKLMDNLDNPNKDNKKDNPNINQIPNDFFMSNKKPGFMNFIPAFTTFEFVAHRVDILSSNGDIEGLNNWLQTSINNNKKNLNLHELDYTDEAINLASGNGKTESLDWWLSNNKKYGIPLKYSKKAINLASENGHINILHWWLNSGLKLKYDEEAIDLASNKKKLEVLDWWYVNYKLNKVEFKYSTNSLDNISLSDDDLLELIKWWESHSDKKKLNIKNRLELKYSEKFVYIIKNTDSYPKSLNYIKDKKLIKVDDFKEEVKEDKKKDSKKMGFINILDLLGGNNKKESNKRDLSALPEEIQIHIKEKEEELNNNLMINGKAKEYIDNIMKIPFGKYREEKIFSFMNDLIKKVNEVYSQNLKNESDLKEYILTISSKNKSNLNEVRQNKSKLKEVKQKKVDTNPEIYKKMYEDFCKYRIDYLKYVDEVLENTVYGHNRTKLQMKCIITQWLSGCKTGIVLGVQGPPGVGKTTLIKGSLSQCLVDFIEYDLGEKPYIKLKEFNRNDNKVLDEEKRPFCFISLGGSTNSSTLIGHNITYHGATSGDIVKCLKEAKCMNPILYFDELDKISRTEHGYEISSVLTHITDTAQNSHFTDRYFSEVKIDLSRCIIVFSYNDASKIDRILYDRIQEIKMHAIPIKEKVEICNKFLLPEILGNIGYNHKDILINNNVLENLILEYTYEAGVRKLKERLQEIIRKYNYNNVITNEKDVHKTNVILEEGYIENVLHDHHKMNLKKITKEPQVGCIHGMYATTNGLGDIMLIQVKKIYNKDILGLQTTGSLEKVISESMGVAKTVAWNLLNDKEQKKIIKKFTNTGLHIHCPDGSTTKDGPSAGTAITCAIYSLLTEKPIKNDIAITGEIDLDGNVTAIGGLDAKLNGAKKAGIRLVLVPEENKRDIDILKDKFPELFDDNFRLEFVNRINQVLNIVFG